MVRSQILVALVAGAAGYRRSHQTGQSDLHTAETVDGGFEALEEASASGPLGSCSVVSRRRAFSTTCACRRRSKSDPKVDKGLQCIDSTMQCGEGEFWDGENCAGAAAPPAPAPASAPAAWFEPAAAPPAPASAGSSHSTHRRQQTPLAAPLPGSGDSTTNPVVELYMYRAQEFDGETPYAMENVNMADLPGVLQYIHREIIAEHTIGAVDKLTGEARGARKYDISTILRYRFLIKNPDTLSKTSMDFNGYVTYDFGQASNEQQWGDFTQHGDFVGVQPQSNAHVPFTDPYYWFSVSGFCPNLPFTSSAVTVLCPEDPSTHSGTCGSKMESKDYGCHSGGDVDRCLCYEGGSVVWGGLCGADEHRNPPTALEVPTGERGCTYSYEPRAESVSIDELVGITAEMCNGQPCKDWADFRVNCDNRNYRRSFTPLGGIKSTPYCVEYDIHPDCAQLGCDHPTCKKIPDDKKELGLPFWHGRCSARSNSGRAEIASASFGNADAASTHQISVPPAPEYADVKCNRPSSLECSPNWLNGEGYCTRAFSGICTSCRVPGTVHPAANRATGLCPLTIASGEYNSLLSGGQWCQTPLKPSNLCCLYSDSCSTKLADVPGMVNELPLDSDSLALVMGAKNTDTAKTFLTRLATELLGVSSSDLLAQDAAMNKEAYWLWNDKPSQDLIENDVVEIIKATDMLHAMFPSSVRYTTAAPTTTTATTTARKWAYITAAPASADAGDLSPECTCSESGIVNGIDTRRPGCANHLGRGYGPFCYIEGGKKCPGQIKFSRSMGLHFRRKC